jgi:adenine-specific DNA-methyltransferase
VLDLACGSGSFLIRAYDALLGWEAELAGMPMEQLTHEYRMPVLRRNIFGVDLDPQAVEIARWNLLLRALREPQRLPELRGNIKRGNSLISEGAPEMHPFDWEREFPDIMKAGGFDVIIGNPPYLKEYIDHQPFHDMRAGRLAKYYQGKMDIWYAFTCLAIDLLKPGGLHSFIATNNWPTNSGASLVRQKILSETQIVEFVDFGDYRVFETAGIQTMIYILQKTAKPHEGRIRYRRLTCQDPSVPDMNDFLFDRVQDNLAVSFDAAVESKKRGRSFTFVPDVQEGVLANLEGIGNYRLKSNEIAQGIICPQEAVLPRHLADLPDKHVEPGSGIFILSNDEKRLLGVRGLERKIVKPYYTTEELVRYYGAPQNKLWIIYTTPEVTKHIVEYPNIKAHLDRFGSIITSDNWPYGLHRARDENFFVGEKIISLRKTSRPHFTYTDFPCYVSQTFFVLKPIDINLKYLVAMLNSKVCHFWLDKKGKKQGDALQVDKAPLLEIPIRMLDLAKPAEKRQHDGIVGLVEEILGLQARLAPQRDTPSAERDDLVHRIALTDRAIDEAVYALYGLTDAERQLVEGET